MSGLPSIGWAPDIPAMAARIRAAWASAVGSILMTGTLMHQARCGLKKDQWQELLTLLPFSTRWVQMLTAIGADSRLTKHASFLPSDAYTLYQLTRLSDQRFDELIDKGEIHPTMRRAAATAETRAERRAADEARVANLVPAPGTHRTLVIDPPWDFDWLSDTAKAQPGDATMSLEEIAALPVPAWSDADCHLYLWTPNNFVPQACDIVSRRHLG